MLNQTYLISKHPQHLLFHQLSLYVCVCHHKKPTTGGQKKFWSKIQFLILACDDKLFQKGGGSHFFRIFVFQHLCAKFEPPNLRLWRPLVKEYIANFGL